MEAVLKGLEDIAEAKLGRMATEKREGKPLIVYNSTFIPAELIRAAGANAYLLCRGGDDAPAKAALDYTLECINPLARACVGYIASGMDSLAGMADLVITAYSDSHMCRMSELLEFRGIDVFKVGVPVDWQEKTSLDYYLNALKNMLRRVERVTGRPADMDRAREEFALSNRVKLCCRRMEEIRRRDAVPIGLESVMRLHGIGALLTEEREICELESFTEALASAPPIFQQDAPRLLAVMRSAAVGDYGVMRLIDESGCPVVAELIDECGIPAVPVPPEGELLESFARSRYSMTLPVCAFQPSWQLRFQHILELINEYGIDGVIWYTLANDEIYDMEYTCAARRLSEMRIPSVKLETDFDYSSDKQAARKTQLHRFVRSLKKRQ